MSNMRARLSCLAGFAALTGSLSFGATAVQADRLRNACSGDYHRFCGQYRPNSSQMRACMQANGRALSNGCINALVDAGIVDRARIARSR